MPSIFLAMISNYLKLAFRNLKNNRLFSVLNIAGLAVGLASGMLVMLWVADEVSYNKFIPNLDKIYMVLQNQTQGGETYTFVSTPGPLAGALRTEMPEVAKAARTSWSGEHLLTYGEKSVYERGFYAEPEFFNIFHLPVISGDPAAALKDAGSVVITERTAKKFFGSEDPIGKILQHNNLHSLKVAAVVRDIPMNSTIRFDVALPFRIFELDNTDWIGTWGNNALPTYVELQPGANVPALNAKMENFIQEKSSDAAAHVFAYPLSEWRLHGKFENGKPSGGRIDILKMLGLIGAFILLIACINFMNLATARSEKRAREVGVRKSIGASRSSLIAQFLGESMVITFLALGLALFLTRLILPTFNRVLDKSMAFSSADGWVWGGIVGLGLLTGAIAGSYPAFFLSKFQPVKVLKGSITAEGKGNGLFRRGLVTFQFVISIFLIIATIVIYRQIQHAQNRPIGYEQSNLIEIPARGDMGDKFEALKNDLLQIPGVESATAASHDMIHLGSNTSGILWPGRTEDQDFLITTLSVGYDWSKTVGVKMMDGRDFSPEFGHDTKACLLNQTAVRRMGLKEPVVGTVIEYDTARTVIGVVEDFVFNDPFSKPSPMAVFFETDGMSSFFIRLKNNQQWSQNLAQVESAFKKHNPAYPFEPRFTSDVYQEQFEGARSAGLMAQLFGGLAIFISCLGLFGLSAFTAERRQKEIGVRKVLGATVQNVLLHLSKDFLKPVLLAFVLAAPLAFWAMQKVLTEFDYRIQLQWWMFALAACLVVVVAALTVSYQSIRAALANPVKSLRSE